MGAGWRCAWASSAQQHWAGCEHATTCLGERAQLGQLRLAIAEVTCQLGDGDGGAAHLVADMLEGHRLGGGEVAIDIQISGCADALRLGQCKDAGALSISSRLGNGRGLVRDLQRANLFVFQCGRRLAAKGVVEELIGGLDVANSRKHF